MKKVNTKPSAKKKLIPAAGSLLISAAMLGTSTYAWFTMSREVEVQNIQMTATTPEDTQLSLGAMSLAGGTADATTDVSLAANTGCLKVDADGIAVEPGNVSEYWSNTADISNYYAFGKLIPASSTTGTNIFFTPDANGVGKTVDPNGSFYVAATGENAANEPTGSGTYKATAFAYTQNNNKNASGTWEGYNTAVAWDDTRSDGYYIDIPVWLRTSSTEGATLAVEAYVKDVANTDASNQLAGADTATVVDGNMLYRAVRVAVLDPTSSYSNATSGSLIAVADSEYNSGSVLDWYHRTANNGSGTKTNANNGGAVASLSGTKAVYATPTTYDGSSATITLGAGTGRAYGDASQYIIRVWLEGEDPDCWNDTSGQDWSINLKFVNTTTTS